MEAVIMTNRKIEGAATVTRRYSTTAGMAWESQAAEFSFDGELFVWIKTDNEAVISDLREGDTVNIRAFARPNRRLFRVQVTK